MAKSEEKQIDDDRRARLQLLSYHDEEAPYHPEAQRREDTSSPSARRSASGAASDRTAWRVAPVLRRARQVGAVDDMARAHHVSSKLCRPPDVPRRRRRRDRSRCSCDPPLVLLFRNAHTLEVVGVQRP